MGNMKPTMKLLRALGLWLVSFVLIGFEASAYEEVTVTNGGIISGTVRLQGAAPKAPRLQITKFKEVCKERP